MNVAAQHIHNTQNIVKASAATSFLYRDSVATSRRGLFAEYVMKFIPKSDFLKLRRLKAQQFVWDYKLSHPCVDCGESDPVVLEFDHIDAATKIDSVGRMAEKPLAINNIKREIEKCRLLCCNCHRRRTARQFGWYRDLGYSMPEKTL